MHDTELLPYADLQYMCVTVLNCNHPCVTASWAVLPPNRSDELHVAPAVQDTRTILLSHTQTSRDYYSYSVRAQLFGREYEYTIRPTIRHRNEYEANIRYSPSFPWEALRSSPSYMFNGLEIRLSAANSLTHGGFSNMECHIFSIEASCYVKSSERQCNVAEIRWQISKNIKV